MHIFYIVIKVLIVLGFLENLFTIFYKFNFIYILDGLLNLATICVIIGLKGRKEVQALLYLFIIILFTSTYIAYDMYESIFVTFLNVLVGLIIIGFLYSYQYEVD